MYDEPTNVAAAEPEPDPRIIAMHRVVDLEKQAEYTSRDAEERQKRAAIVREELSAARDELFGLLGLPSRTGNKSPGEAEAMRESLRAQFGNAR